MRRIWPLLLLLAAAGAGEDPVAAADRLVRSGKRAEALAVLEKAPDDLRALVEKGRLLDRMGRRDEASAVFAGFPERSKREWKAAEELTAVAAGCQEHALRTHDKDLLKRVMKELYTEAQKAGPRHAPARREAGFLFIEKFQYSQAAQEFASALKIDSKDALSAYGLALTDWGRGDFQHAQEHCREALALAPDLEEALMLMGWMALWDDEEAEALSFSGKVLQKNAASEDALTLEAASAFVRGDGAVGQKRLEEAQAVRPGWPGTYRAIAGAFESRHRARDAIQWLQRGLRACPEDPGLLADLGTIYLHESRDGEGRALIERAYALDPFNARLSNILNLLDDLKGWKRFQTPHFRIRCHPAEADVLGGLLGKSLERDWAEITALYGYEPETQPIAVEMYPEQTDFAVRTIGQPNLGALGVCFGHFVAVDSPAVQEQMEPFHWADVARHEFTHVVTLQMSDFRIPRWLTEGLSVYAERYPRLPFDTLLVSAAAQGRILRMRDFNKAFSRPAYPGQVQLAYAQGGEIARFVAEGWGFEALKAMLKGYRKGKDTEAVILEALGLTLDAFDTEFGKFLAGRLKSVQCIVPVSDKDLKALLERKGAELEVARQSIVRRQWVRAGEWARKSGNASGEGDAILGEALRREGKVEEAEAHLRKAVSILPGYHLGHRGLGHLLAARGDRKEAVECFRRARACYPHDCQGDDNPYRGEADACFALGRVDEGIAAMRALCEQNGLDTKARLDLATALRDQGRAEEAVKVLDEALYGDASTPGLHRLRGEIYRKLGRKQEAAEAFGLGSHAHPGDKEAARLAAEAWEEAGDEGRAKGFRERMK